MNIHTKRLSVNRALQILQLRYGTQVKRVWIDNGLYFADSVCRYQRQFTRQEVLDIESALYGQFGF